MISACSEAAYRHRRRHGHGTRARAIAKARARVTPQWHVVRDGQEEGGGSAKRSAISDLSNCFRLQFVYIALGGKKLIYRVIQLGGLGCTTHSYREQARYVWQVDAACFAEHGENCEKLERVWKNT